MLKKILLILFLLFTFEFQVQATELDKKIAQMIIIGFDGTSIKDKGVKRVINQLKNNEIGGVILFSKNIKDKTSLIKLNSALLEANEITPFIAIDNEGGKIQRYDFLKTKSALEVSKLSIDEAKLEYQKMAELENELKINFNFAPCVDLAINKNSIIAKKQRSYSKDPETVIKYSKIFIDEHAKNNIITSLKHFPNHGSIEGDTHKGFVDATDSFKDEELTPYIALKDYNNLTTIMVSHIYNKKFDKKYPASLSSATIKDYLIKEIGFEGVIVSDDYDMEAIRKNYSLDEIIVNSINSGVNILLFSNNLKYKDKKLPSKIHKIVKNEIKKGTISIDDIENSYNKIIKLKSSL